MRGGLTVLDLESRPAKSVDDVFVENALVERCRQIGIRADYWVVNDPRVARSLLEAGATIWDLPAGFANKWEHQFVTWAEKAMPDSPLIAKRTKWLVALREGRNPFDDGTLAALREEQ